MNRARIGRSDHFDTADQQFKNNCLKRIKQALMRR